MVGRRLHGESRDYYQAFREMVTSCFDAEDASSVDASYTAAASTRSRARLLVQPFPLSYFSVIARDRESKSHEIRASLAAAQGLVSRAKASLA